MIYLSFPILFTTVGYGFIKRKKIVHDLAILFLSEWYGLPKRGAYDKSRKRDWTFFKQRAPYLSAPSFAIGNHYIDLLAKHRNGAAIFLGALPKTKHAIWLKNHKIDLVISMIEDREYDAPVFPKNGWEGIDIEFCHCPSPDFEPLSTQTLEKATRIATRALRVGKKIYIHCKAGRGRSSAVAVMALSMLTKESIDEIYAKVKAARPQVSLSSQQLAPLKAKAGANPLA